MTLLPAPLRSAAQTVLTRHSQAGTMIATAESCTGGLVSAALVGLAGSSAVVERGFVTYSNEAKADMLGVPMAMILEHGAVSRDVAVAMAEGALRHSRAHCAVSITGIAGPGGGSAEKPVGLVHFALARRDQPCHAEHHIFPGDRDAVRLAATLRALTLLAL